MEKGIGEGKGVKAWDGLGKKRGIEGAS